MRSGLRFWLAAVGVAVAAVALAVSAAAGIVLRPPVIREPWTPLPCPAHPKTTVAYEGCFERAIMRSDHRIDASAARIFRLLRRRSDRLAFLDGEYAWLRYRRQSCSVEASVYQGGSAEPVALLSCEKQRNVEHLADLTAMERALRRR